MQATILLAASVSAENGQASTKVLWDAWTFLTTQDTSADSIVVSKVKDAIAPSTHGYISITNTCRALISVDKVSSVITEIFENPLGGGSGEDAMVEDETPADPEPAREESTGQQPDAEMES